MLREKIVHKILKVPHTLHIGVDTGEQPGTTIVLIHGLARTHTIWNYVLKMLPDNTRVISVDLLGFGASPRPEWKKYNAEEQAMSLRMTLLKKRVRGNVILVGHSLGALVAIEYARKYPSATSALVLCGTPLYKSEPRKLVRSLKLPTGEDLHRSMLRRLREQSDFTKKLNYYARKVKFIQDDFIVDDSNMMSVTRSMEMAIENQSAFEWLMTTEHRTALMYGRFDPFVIKKYYKTLWRHNPNISIHPVLAAHEINRNKAYAVALASVLGGIIKHPLQSD